MSDSEPRMIVITGFMAAGKTTVARALARRLNCEMLDLDETIAEREKRTIPDLINEEGETNFREAETETLREVLEKRAARVVALGGGAWTLSGNRALVAEHDCITVWLDAPFELCWQRITNQNVLRPLALDRKSTHELYLKRRPQYELAQLRIKMAAERSAEEISGEIERALRRESFVKS
ncbi:MAG: hypothetical protein AUG51_17570 [Acidobacteria bacterium 13_1_20CM_3_53_8]|nr:MAG: hypothetical protein AUG51_17570 [Acidobacteria bacterium 13_1_20CM_3_53_8]